jgi:hypothetical protein
MILVMPLFFRATVFLKIRAISGLHLGQLVCLLPQAWVQLNFHGSS